MKLNFKIHLIDTSNFILRLCNAENMGKPCPREQQADPLPSKSGQKNVVPKDAKCSETYAKNNRIFF